MARASPLARAPSREGARDAERLEQSIREESAAFVRRVGSLSDDPEVRHALLKQAVREVAWRLFHEFGDHYALAEQLELMSELAWQGPNALRAAERSATTAAPTPSGTATRRTSEVVAKPPVRLCSPAGTPADTDRRKRSR